MTITNNVPKTPQAAAVAAIVTIIFIASITVAADLLPPLKTWLASTFTHHWIGKGVLAAIIFAGLYGLLSVFGRNAQDETVAAYLKLLNVLTVLGGLVIVAFFFYEAFLK